MCNTSASTASATGTKLFIGNLPLSATADGLRDVASAYGTVEEVVVLHRTSPSGNRCGFVRFSDAASAAHARNGISASCYPGAEVMMVARFADRTRATRAGTETASSDLTKLFVGNLQNDVNEPELWAMFAPYGEVMEVVLMRKASVSGCRCAFVRFNDSRSAGAAVDSLHGMKNGSGVPLVVRIADPARAAEMGMGASSSSIAESTGYCSAPSPLSHSRSSPHSGCSTPPLSPDTTYALSDTDTLTNTPPSSPGLSHQRRGVPLPVPHEDAPFLLPVPLCIAQSQGMFQKSAPVVPAYPQTHHYHHTQQQPASLLHQPYPAASWAPTSVSGSAHGFCASLPTAPVAKCYSASSPTRRVCVHNPYSFAAFDEYEAEY